MTDELNRMLTKMTEFAEHQRAINDATDSWMDDITEELERLDRRVCLLSIATALVGLSSVIHLVWEIL